MRTGLIAFMIGLTMSAVAAQEPTIDPSLSPEERGHAIAVEADQRREGFDDEVTTVTMELEGSDGRVRTRQFTMQTLEMTSGNAADRSLAIFHQPRDVAGTAVLSHTYNDQPNEQWLYLPSLRRVRRIPPANLSGAFVGSELTYEDLLSENADRFEHRWLRDEPCDDRHCFVIERRPVYENSGYSRQVVWIDQEEFRTIQIEFYDQEERFEKTLVLEDYRLYLDSFWRAHRLTMDNHRTGRRTVLTAEPYEFRSGFTQRDFEPSVLTRIR